MTLDPQAIGIGIKIIHIKYWWCLFMKCWKCTLYIKITALCDAWWAAPDLVAVSPAPPVSVPHLLSLFSSQSRPSLRRDQSQGWALLCPGLLPGLLAHSTTAALDTLYHSSSCLLIRLIPLVSGLNEEKLPPGGVITIANCADHKQCEGKFRQRFGKSLHLAADYCIHVRHCWIWKIFIFEM